MTISQKQIEAVLKLDSPARYHHFVKVVADREKVWGLDNDGWALAGSNDDEVVFPIWPEQEYAALCAVNEWSGFEPLSMTLDEFLANLLPQLKGDNVLLGVFYSPNDNGVVVPADRLNNDIHAELQNY